MDNSLVVTDDSAVQEIIRANGAHIFAVIGLTQGIKMLGMPSKYLPLTSIVIGVLFGLAQNGLSFVSGFHGLIVGIVATGLVNRADKYLTGNSTVINNNAGGAVYPEAGKAEEVAVTPQS